MRSYQGHAPDPAEGWEKIGEFQDETEGSWRVYRQQQEHSPDWGTYKVAATEPVAGRANYWFTRNDSTGQLGFGRDLHQMRTARPKLYEAVLAATGEAA